LFVETTIFRKQTMPSMSTLTCPNEPRVENQFAVQEPPTKQVHKDTQQDKVLKLMMAKGRISLKTKHKIDEGILE
jgi:hypothetical protein